MHAAVDESRIPELEEIVRLALAEARRRGASECQVDASLNQGISASVRLGEIDTVEYQRDNYFPPIDDAMVFARTPKEQDVLDHWAVKRFKGQRPLVFAYFEI